MLLIRTLLPLCVSIVSALPHQRRVTTSGSVPSYALTYAPYIHLWSEETWWPSALATHLEHCTAYEDYELIASQPSPLTIGNLDFDNISNMYTQSNDNVEDNPAWLLSSYGKPNSAGVSASATIMVMIDKADLIGAGYVDVFYYTFYSYNHGSKVLGTRYGNHVGDWESVMIRFLDGTPQSIHISEHSDGKAYTYSAVEKSGVRPVFYSAGGSHAVYATAGQQNYALPFGLLSDTTDAGPLWDLAGNYSAFWYSESAGFVAATGNTWPTNFLDYVGLWGDKKYKTSDSRQNCITSTECHYVDGPNGPIGHNLLRTTICEDTNCTAATSI